MGEFHSDGPGTSGRVVDSNERGGAGRTDERGEWPHHLDHDSIWKERNRRVFDKVTKTRSWLSSQIWDEWRVWQFALQWKKLSRGTVGSRE